MSGGFGGVPKNERRILGAPGRIWGFWAPRPHQSMAGSTPRFPVSASAFALRDRGDHGGLGGKLRGLSRDPPKNSGTPRTPFPQPLPVAATPGRAPFPPPVSPRCRRPHARRAPNPISSSASKARPGPAPLSAAIMAAAASRHVVRSRGCVTWGRRPGRDKRRGNATDPKNHRKQRKRPKF